MLVVRMTYATTQPAIACPRCQKAARAGARFCFRCGQPIVWRSRRRSGAWIIPLLVFLAFGGVFSSIQRAARRQVFSPPAQVSPVPTYTPPRLVEEHIPPSVWPAIQCDVAVSSDLPGQTFRAWVYNGSSMDGVRHDRRACNPGTTPASPRGRPTQPNHRPRRHQAAHLRHALSRRAADSPAQPALRWSSRIIDITGTRGWTVEAGLRLRLNDFASFRQTLKSRAEKNRRGSRIVGMFTNENSDPDVPFVATSFLFIPWAVLAYHPALSRPSSDPRHRQRLYRGIGFHNLPHRTGGLDGADGP